MSARQGTEETFVVTAIAWTIHDELQLHPVSETSKEITAIGGLCSYIPIAQTVNSAYVIKQLSHVKPLKPTCNSSKAGSLSKGYALVKGR